ncbi:diphosphomevalonate decarboxylase [Enterococcus sp. JM4C]|uniref:diphosphomevalonate decarboxylase n=1 Tax=Candidatus Enterococcus huntleyi TaxID=1857217 RepID=UPI00137ABD41|nr:diphosphomevalonate decarboxylase [Enterococcus sp. JM4C]KAF1299549.1 diphosphomevalonate decarboxylase [Enterococcus sp. JM4C]
MHKGRARAYTNIALIKYWGKKDETLILPMNNSLSLTLNAFYTETEVIFDETYTQDSFYLDGELQDAKATSKVSQFLDIVRQLSEEKSYAQVTSKNFVPTAAGLASSASGLAALAAACNEALDLQLSDRALSRLARRGSGSACRSIFGGFVEWEQGTDDASSYAQPLNSDDWTDDLAMLFILVNDQQKDISSRDGMKRTVETSSFYPGWLEEVPKDLAIAKKAISEKDFTTLGTVTEANCLKMHGTTLAAVPPFTYWSPDSLKAMQAVRSLRSAGIECYFTMDAGPNVKLLIEKKNLAQAQAYLETLFDSAQLVSAFAGPGIEILK